MAALLYLHHLDGAHPPDTGGCQLLHAPNSPGWKMARNTRRGHPKPTTQEAGYLYKSQAITRGKAQRDLLALLGDIPVTKHTQSLLPPTYERLAAQKQDQ